MANTKIQFKRSNTSGNIPTVSSLDYGEIAINTFDGKLYIKQNNGSPSVVAIGAGNVYSAGVGISIDINNVISSNVTSNGPTGRIQTSNGLGGFTAFPVGLSGQVLTSNGATSSWQNIAPTGVSSVDVAGGTTGFSFTGGPITTNGVITMTGLLAIASGGTGATTASAALTNLLPVQAIGTTGSVLTSNGTNATWQAPSAGVTSVDASGGSTGLTVTGGPITSSGTLVLGGTLSIGSGGTGATTATAAITNLLPTQATNAGKVLTTNGSVVSWQTPAGGVTSINVSGGTTGLSFSGGPITSTGTIVTGGTLGLANGGTGVTTLTALQTLIFPVQGASAGKFLQTDGSTITWQTPASAPGGSSTQIQYNNGGALAGAPGVTYSAGALNAASFVTTVSTAVTNVSTTGGTTGNVVDVAASTIDCTTANYFRKTASGALTWAFSNVPAAGRAYICVLRLQNGGVGLQTWPATVVWPGGVAPTLTASGFDLLLFETDNGGSSWRGASLLNYTA